MAQDHAHHAGGQVDVFLAVDVFQNNALAAFEYHSRLVAPPEDVLLVTRHQFVMRIGELKAFFHHPPLRRLSTALEHIAHPRFR